MDSFFYFTLSLYHFQDNFSSKCNLFCIKRARMYFPRSWINYFCKIHFYFLLTFVFRYLFLGVHFFFLKEKTNQKRSNKRTPLDHAGCSSRQKVIPRLQELARTSTSCALCAGGYGTPLLSVGVDPIRSNGNFFNPKRTLCPSVDSSATFISKKSKMKVKKTFTPFGIPKGEAPLAESRGSALRKMLKGVFCLVRLCVWESSIRRREPLRSCC